MIDDDPTNDPQLTEADEIVRRLSRNDQALESTRDMGVLVGTFYHAARETAPDMGDYTAMELSKLFMALFFQNGGNK